MENELHLYENFAFKKKKGRRRTYCKQNTFVYSKFIRVQFVSFRMSQIFLSFISLKQCYYIIYDIVEITVLKIADDKIYIVKSLHVCINIFCSISASLLMFCLGQYRSIIPHCERCLSQS